MPRHRFVLTGLGLSVALFLAPAHRSIAFENERLGAPIKGEAVSDLVTFYISADGRPIQGEAYKIEIARDSDFEKIVTTFDGSKERGGWSLGDPKGIEDVPPELAPTNFLGIHLRVQPKLADGEYFWRAAKTTGGGGWTEVRGSESFVVDTRAPADIDTLRLRRLPDGSIQLWWAPITYGSDNQPETVAGYRVYRYEKLLMRYPPMTRYLLRELQADTTVTIPLKDTEPSMVFYRVSAVDEVGNEDGRRRPAPIGALDAQFNPPDADALTDPKVLRRMYEEAREKEKKN